MITVYIIYSESTDKFYVGMTGSLRKRLKAHTSGRTRSTSSTNDWKLVWNSKVNQNFEARALEKKIKARGAKRYLQDLDS